MRAGVLFLIVAGVTLVAYRMLRKRTGDPRTAFALCALLSSVMIGAALTPTLLRDSGTTGTAAAVVPPLVLAGAVAAVSRVPTPSARAALTWVGTAVMFAFVAVYALGYGLFYIPTALLLLCAASVRPKPARRLRTTR